MQLVGSEAPMVNITSRNPDELALPCYPSRKSEGKRCFTIEVKDKVATDAGQGCRTRSKWILTALCKSQSIIKTGIKSSFVTLSDFQPVVGQPKKVQPMMIVTEDFETQKLTEMRILKIASRPDLSEADFELPAEQGI